MALKSWRYSSKIYARPVVRGGVARAPLSPPKIGGTGDTLSKTKMKKMKRSKEKIGLKLNFLLPTLCGKDLFFFKLKKN